MPAKERRMPTVEQIKDDVFAGRGGLCYTLNTFMKLFLEALGYAAHHIAGTVIETNGHIMTRVDIEGNVFLVDVGCGYPTFEAVPVNFEEESVVYKQSFLVYKFTKSKETTCIVDVIKRKHRTSKNWKEVITKVDPDGWWQFYYVDLTPRNLDFFIEPMTKVYTTAGITPFHDSLRLVVFPDSNMFGFKDKTLLVGKDSGVVHSTLTSDQVVQTVTSHFPVLKEAVNAAIINLGWN